MDIEKVFAIFCRLSGLNEEESVGLRFICESSLDHVRSRLKCGVDIRHFCGRIEYAAAALAYYRYVLWGMTDGAGNEIKVGDISVKGRGIAQLEAAEKFCKEAFDSLSSIISDNHFVFEGI
ncbi:MAG: hypothetical protein IJ861_09425 [Clostridia bacterium]|nr:hypothetical protein [Clostridia bacterium]